MLPTRVHPLCSMRRPARSSSRLSTLSSPTFRRTMVKPWGSGHAPSEARGPPRPQVRRASTSAAATPRALCTAAPPGQLPPAWDEGSWLSKVLSRPVWDQKNGKSERFRVETLTGVRACTAQLQHRELLAPQRTPDNRHLHVRSLTILLVPSLIGIKKIVNPGAGKVDGSGKVDGCVHVHPRSCNTESSLHRSTPRTTATCFSVHCQSRALSRSIWDKTSGTSERFRVEKLTGV